MSISCSFDSKCNQVAVWLQEDNWLNEWKRRQADKWCDFSNTLSRRWEEPALGGDNGVGRMVQLFSSVQFSSVAQSCLTLCDPRDCSTPGLPVHHQIPQFIQTQVYHVGDAIQPSYPLSSPSPPTFNLSQYQGLFKWVSSSHQVAKALEFQLQYQSFQEHSGLISFRMD